MFIMVSFFNRLLGVFSIALIIDLYAYQAVKTATAHLKNERLRKSLRIGYWVMSAGFLIPAFFTLVTSFFYPIREAGWLFQLIFALFALLYVPKMIVALFMLAEDAYRLGKKLKNSLTPKPHTSVVEIDVRSGVSGITRKQFISQAGLMAASVPFMGVLHGLTVGRYNFQVFKQDVSFTDLPDAFSGLRIVHISDIHSGSFDSLEAVRKGVDLILEQRPDLVLFTGDLVNSIADEVTDWKKEFARIKAPLGVYSILGNHDYGDYAVWESEADKMQNFQNLVETHAQLGWKLLRNESHILTRNGQKLAVAGVENWGIAPFPQYGDLDKALHDIPEGIFTLLLSHDPTHWDYKVLDHHRNIHLTFSGHTHGMQFGVELGDIRWSPVSWKYPRWAGLYEEAGKFLYVNRGFGTVGFPGRVGIFPEVTLLTLRKSYI